MLTTMLDDHLMGSIAIDPRDYQKRIVSQVLDMFSGRYSNRNGVQPPAKSVMIESPTGSGKTVMGMLAAAHMVKSEDVAVGWVAMRRNLLTQAVKENAEKGFNLPAHFISMFDKNPSTLVEARRSGKKVLMVVDECHHDAASSMTHLHNVIQPDYVLGLSATPYRTDKITLAFERVIKDAGIHQLIQAGYLSKYDHFTIPNWSVDTVAQAYHREPERWGKSVFFFKNLEECHSLQRILLGFGHKSEVVTGDTDVERQIADFTEGKVEILVNCQKLTEGFDCPSIKTAWVRDSGKGCTTQMAGRVFRIHPDLPKKQIVQSKLTRWNCIKTAMPACQYSWENGEWLSLTVNPKIEQINKIARMAIAKSKVKLPKFIASRGATIPLRRRG